MTKERKAKSMQTTFRKATGTTLSLADARAIIDSPPSCPYCTLPIYWQDLSVDHRTPTARGGASTPSNIVWTDLNCNVTKGKLTDTEFGQLMAFLSDKPYLKQYIITRLKAAGGILYGTSRRWRRSRRQARFRS
jgi:5-methylcytosine-specific restriction endonuclease McrA